MLFSKEAIKSRSDPEGIFVPVKVKPTMIPSSELDNENPDSSELPPETFIKSNRLGLKIVYKD